uniref:Kinesin motor domain-containing protein n=1 Tax=Chromera velia CCMP2878 TaxID=1169474 RepID=A0A0G4HBS9_9ALVE|eukprot:Cvel_6240.t1-p1 / transcript=Cvel_6240.t1 / gene=Cvel_6240 / organism=Chromera_velia_CCMP2878 / gene_product=Kinesin-like protein KIF19, putative / transcript_product=Kinesin-like protein KIF19, putative / location=Cvel_scaffold302:30955-38939(-) / protein_length=1475 / sequence_SO=supercontig / SO=protein_coding / is_pseudo=false
MSISSVSYWSASHPLCVASVEISLQDAAPWHTSAKTIELSDSKITMRRQSLAPMASLAPSDETRLHFNYDGVFGQKATNEEVYTSTTLPLVGKVIDDLFKRIKETASHYEEPSLFTDFEDEEEKLDGKTFNVRISVLEIYNDKVCDLLAGTVSDSNTSNSAPADRGGRGSLKRGQSSSPLKQLDKESPAGKDPDNLDVREDPVKGFFVPGICELPIGDQDAALRLLKQADSRRHFAQTNFNERSSRSHVIVSLTVECQTAPVQKVQRTVTEAPPKVDREQQESEEADTTENDPNGPPAVVRRSLPGRPSLLAKSLPALQQLDLPSQREGSDLDGEETRSEYGGGKAYGVPEKKPSTTTVGVLQIVDLAGNEKTSQATASRSTFEEGKFINTGLFHLSEVISRLSERKGASPQSERYINYRNSKLTKLLHCTLEGNGRAVLLATISPTAQFTDESLQTLRFAQKFKAITKLCTRNYVNEKDSIIVQMAAIIKSLRKEVKDLKKQQKANPTQPPTLEGETSGRAGDGFVSPQETSPSTQRDDMRLLSTLQMQMQLIRSAFMSHEPSPFCMTPPNELEGSVGTVATVRRRYSADDPRGRERLIALASSLQPPSSNQAVSVVSAYEQTDGSCSGSGVLQSNTTAMAAEGTHSGAPASAQTRPPAPCPVQRVESPAVPCDDTESDVIEMQLEDEMPPKIFTTPSSPDIAVGKPILPPAPKSNRSSGSALAPSQVSPRPSSRPPKPPHSKVSPAKKRPGGPRENSPAASASAKSGGSSPSASPRSVSGDPEPSAPPSVASVLSGSGPSLPLPQHRQIQKRSNEQISEEGTPVRGDSGPSMASAFLEAEHASSSSVNPVAAADERKKAEAASAAVSDSSSDCPVTDSESSCPGGGPDLISRGVTAEDPIDPLQEGDADARKQSNRPTALGTSFEGRQRGIPPTLYAASRVPCGPSLTVPWTCLGEGGVEEVEPQRTERAHAETSAMNQWMQDKMRSCVSLQLDRENTVHDELSAYSKTWDLFLKKAKGLLRSVATKEKKQQMTELLNEQDSLFKNFKERILDGGRDVRSLFEGKFLQTDVTASHTECSNNTNRLESPIPPAEGLETIEEGEEGSASGGNASSSAPQSKHSSAGALEHSDLNVKNAAQAFSVGPSNAERHLPSPGFIEVSGAHVQNPPEQRSLRPPEIEMPLWGSHKVGTVVRLPSSSVHFMTSPLHINTMPPPPLPPSSLLVLISPRSTSHSPIPSPSTTYHAPLPIPPPPTPSPVNPQRHQRPHGGLFKSCCSAPDEPEIEQSPLSGSVFTFAPPVRNEDHQTPCTLSHPPPPRSPVHPPVRFHSSPFVPAPPPIMPSHVPTPLVHSQLLHVRGRELFQPMPQTDRRDSSPPPLPKEVDASPAPSPADNNENPLFQPVRKTAAAKAKGAPKGKAKSVTAKRERGGGTSTTATASGRAGAKKTAPKAKSQKVGGSSTVSGTGRSRAANNQKG